MIINSEYIYSLLKNAECATKDRVLSILQKSLDGKKLTHEEIAILLKTNDKELLAELFKTAGKVKKSIYGNRIVIFAPLYVSNYCVNDCMYCGYKISNTYSRRKLNMDELCEEVNILLKNGHKRLALEAGEDPINCDIDYIVKCIETIYKCGDSKNNIRRLNVNIAATTVENYKKLKNANIGTYILFQETYDPLVYKKMHPKGPKSDYNYHLTAFDRAMEAGIDDVGAGVLFGLADPYFEVIALMIHNEYLENKFGVGFHTISVPRLKKAEGMDISSFPNLVNDDEFKKIVAVIRLAVPYTGMILSTRESAEMRKELIDLGISQISAGSCTGVGGYKSYAETGKPSYQFEIADHRTPIEIVKELIKDGHIPSYCTACYRSGRTGDRFMELAKSGCIQDVCHPNALLTFMEYILEFGDEELIRTGENYIKQEIEKITRQDIKNFVLESIKKLKDGERDIYL